MGEIWLKIGKIWLKIGEIWLKMGEIWLKIGKIWLKMGEIWLNSISQVFEFYVPHCVCFTDVGTNNNILGYFLKI